MDKQERLIKELLESNRRKTKEIVFWVGCTCTISVGVALISFSWVF